jgi:hypothetical protein
MELRGGAGEEEDRGWPRRMATGREVGGAGSGGASMGAWAAALPGCGVVSVPIDGRDDKNVVGPTLSLAFGRTRVVRSVRRISALFPRGRDSVFLN